MGPFHPFGVPACQETVVSLNSAPSDAERTNPFYCQQLHFQNMAPGVYLNSLLKGKYLQDSDEKVAVKGWKKKPQWKLRANFLQVQVLWQCLLYWIFSRLIWKKLGCLLICAIFSRYLKFNWQLVLKSMSLVENTLHIHWISANTSLMKFPFNSLCSYETTHSKQKRVHYLVECCINSSESTRCKIKVTG